MQKMKHKSRFTTANTGLQPLAIAILLVTMLLSVAGIAYIFLTIQNNAGTQIQIQNVNFQPTATTIYVQNIGNTTVHLRSVQIGFDQFELTASNCTANSEHTTTINQGTTAEITINKAYETMIHIKVITRETAFYEADYKP
jgi:hypothetical protein